MVAALTATTAMLLATLAVGSTAAAIRLNQERNAVIDEQARTRGAEGRRREGLVDALMVAAPDGVPFLIDAIRPSTGRVVPLLRDACLARVGRPAGTPRRLRAAIAATLLGAPEVPAADRGHPVGGRRRAIRRNIVEALAPAKRRRSARSSAAI